MRPVLNSIIIFVQNVSNLKNFYTGKLNLEVIEEIESEWVLLKAGDCNIALHKVGKKYESSDPNFTINGNTKMVFEIEGDIFQEREMLLSEKVSVSEIKTFDNYDYWLCDGEDPEGNIFQLKQKKHL